MNQILLCALLLVPVAGGIALSLLQKAPNKTADTVFIASLLLEAALTLWYLFMPDAAVRLFAMTDTLVVSLSTDAVSRIFLAVGAFGFLPAGIYATRYMAHSERQASFYAFMLFSLAALVGMDISQNLITMYLFFECATLLSMPLVLHDRTEESIRAALKYLFYSIAGAFLALLAIFTVAAYADTLNFTPGGVLRASAGAYRTLLEIVVFLGVIGFGAKAGMYPLHGWLPTAHPVAPAPASAVLSAIIAKAGVLAIFRLVFYIVGADFLRGSWVQIAWLCLALLTVFMGSMMAYREDVFKKRLAYSSVSQISYVLVGLFTMTPDGVTSGLLHVMFHACIKICLFLVAGSVIVNLHKTRVSELKGLGKQMPVTLWAFTIASLGLIGIPPASGFVSKWYLALGALDSGLPVLNWLAPVVLLVSALLTAAYLLPVTINGFFPGRDFAAPARTDEGTAVMWAPIAVLAAVSLLLGVFAGPLVDWVRGIAAALV
ncbi:MAG: proton-conducting membrane transporter [Clostridia bacterium]|nr:proton-conducting membrane transporter [Clostridia bacterium]